MLCCIREDESCWIFCCGKIAYMRSEMRTLDRSPAINKIAEEAVIAASALVCIHPEGGEIEGRRETLVSSY
jgi:hypothetical protein